MLPFFQFYHKVLSPRYEVLSAVQKKRLSCLSTKAVPPAYQLQHFRDISQVRLRQSHRHTREPAQLEAQRFGEPKAEPVRSAWVYRYPYCDPLLCFLFLFLTGQRFFYLHNLANSHCPELIALSRRVKGGAGGKQQRQWRRPAWQRRCTQVARQESPVILLLLCPPPPQKSSAQPCTPSCTQGLLGWCRE
jgi:hypothetical protein